MAVAAGGLTIAHTVHKPRSLSEQAQAAGGSHRASVGLAADGTRRSDPSLPAGRRPGPVEPEGTATTIAPVLPVITARGMFEPGTPSLNQTRGSDRTSGSGGTRSGTGRPSSRSGTAPGPPAGPGGTGPTAGTGPRPPAASPDQHGWSEPKPAPRNPGPTQPGSATEGEAQSLQIIGPTTDSKSQEPEDPPPPPLERDEEGCPNLDLYPIGGVSPETPEELKALAPRFRELAAAEMDKRALVCAKPIEFWRDLAIQRLVSEGTPDGVILTATNGTSGILRLDEIEWTGYRFRNGGSPLGPNFLGYPVARMSFGGASVIRTTHGGLVSARNDTVGIPVIGAAWDIWVAHGGPTGDLGMPMGLPTGFPDIGAYQDFANGWMLLPGVTTDLEALAMPADRYEWHPRLEDLDPAIDGRGKLLETTGMAFYVDPSGLRHWIRTTSDWSCAHWDLGAEKAEVRGYVLGDYPLGDQFVCPS